MANDAEHEMEAFLENCILYTDEEVNDGSQVKSIRSFNAAAILSNNAGLVIKMKDGAEFQITIVQSK